MTIKEVRSVLGTKYDLVPDETLNAFIDLIDAVCTYVVSTDTGQDITSYIQNKNHDP